MLALRRAARLCKAGNYSLILRLIAAKLRPPGRPRPLDPERSVAEPWSVDQVEITDRDLVVRGWSLPGPDSVEIGRRDFRFNGRPFDEVHYPLPRPDVAAVFPSRQNAQVSGFECRTERFEGLYPGGVLEIQRVRQMATAIDRGRDFWFVPDPALHVDLPDEDRRFRVIGNRDRNGFLSTGATDYHRLNRALQAISGRRLHEFRHILDWGSGCGRVARHFPAQHAGALTGCDIDHDNIKWCNGHLAGTFVASTMAPPLPFQSGQFDLVYGISVFTHLREPLQLKWLEELARVTADGAFLLMTVHGLTALEFAGLAADDYRRVESEVERSGLLVTSINSQIDRHAKHRGEYVNVFHSHDYIRRTWGRHFDVVVIIPGYILTHDLVVLRR
jgi:SAM-dependent methyltransferase